jgi:hypothetical protein
LLPRLADARTEISGDAGLSVQGIEFALLVAFGGFLLGANGGGSHAGGTICGKPL